MRRFDPPIFLFACASAAAAAAPAPEVEHALMARVNAFSTLLVGEKYREAEQFVLPESRDFYYAAEKPHILSFEVKKIDWDAGFQTATLEMSADVTMRRPTLGAFKVKSGYYDHWKFDHGEWWFYYPKLVERNTPFGVMKVDPKQASESGLNINQELAKGRAELAAARANSFSASRSSVVLPLKDSSETIVLSNLLPGAIKLRFRLLSGSGFDVSLNAIDVGPKATADLKIFRSPENKAAFKPGAVVVQAFPTGQTMTIPVN